MAPPDDPLPPRSTRQRTAAPGPAEHPSGRWDREYADPEVTPPPVDPETTVAAWYGVRARVGDLQVQMAGLVPSLDGLARRVDQLEQKDAEMARSLVSVERTQAVQTSMLSTIERGISDLKSARENDGARFRHVVQILASIAAIAVSVIAIATR